MARKTVLEKPCHIAVRFVNRRGVKVLELKANDLVSRLREGKARVIEDAATPLMDRALSFLTQSLKNPFVKAAEPSA